MEECDATPFPAVLSLLEYWGDYPPLHVMVRSYLGIGGRDAHGPNRVERDAMNDDSVSIEALPSYRREAIQRAQRHVKRT